MGSDQSKSKKLSAVSRKERYRGWITTKGIKVEQLTEKGVNKLCIEQNRDHGIANKAVGRTPYNSVKVRILPTQNYCVVGLYDLSNQISTVELENNEITRLKGVYAVTMNANELIMDGVHTHYKRNAVSYGGYIEIKYEKDRLFFRVYDTMKEEKAATWDLLSVVGENKQYSFCCQMSGSNSRVEILETK